ncbi:sulfatase-like hydrolase/transferase [Myxococcota bacterium]|nr:sulfatase-like hydrolase/transferase [Myxococcota bacterium]
MVLGRSRAWVGLLVLGACHGPSPADPAAAGPVRTLRGHLSPDSADRPNILLVIADDLGVDQASCYASPVASRAPQPHLDALCARGLVFTDAWANPYCSPTRAGILTGRNSGRTGVGEPTGVGMVAPGLSRRELTLPRALDRSDSGYTHGAFGKWHLADADNGALRHPNIAGFDHFAGGIEGHVEDYFSWSRVVDGVETTSTTYATSATVDDAVDWIREQEDPWFAWVAFHAGHWPRHLPPAELHSYGELTGDEEDLEARPEVYYQAMVEAMDTEMGRLFEEIGPARMRRTVVIFVGDNGTEGTVNQGAFPEGRAKGTLYQGGLRVPLVVAGPGVQARGRQVDAPVHTQDLFSTVLELAGVDVAEATRGRPIDAVSLAPYLADPEAPDQRDFVLSEVFGGGSTARGAAGQAIRDRDLKLIRWLDGTEALYDVEDDPLEEDDLLDGVLSAWEHAAWETLADHLDHHPIDPEFDDEDTGDALR